MPVENLSAVMQTIGIYDLVEKIAEGGMGTVYRGRNRLNGEVVAVKVVPKRDIPTERQHAPGDSDG